MAKDDDTSGQVIEKLCNNGADGENQRKKPIISFQQLDVEAYASLYSGRTKIMRLLHIADRCDIPTMHLEALRLAYDETKKGEDAVLFREVALRIDGRLGADYTVDYAWIEAVERRFAQRREKLENELNVYKTNIIRESIRMGHNDLGDFYYAHGLLADAFKNYTNCRSYCTTPNHDVDMCLNAVLVSIEMGQFSHASSHVVKAEQRAEVLDPVIVTKFRCVAGLVHLKAKNYKLGARKFLEVCPDLGNRYSEVIAPQDVATYGGLCALATFDRSELKNKVIDNVNFRNFLELVPVIRELIHDFYLSEYANCVHYLGNLKPTLLLDIHLHDHVETLYDEIRKKALIQYTLPFVSVDMNKMADAFKTSVVGIQKELEALITSNQIQARIDSHNKILYACHADQRKSTFQRVLQTGSDFDQDIRSMLLRANIIKHELKLKDPRKKRF